MGRGTRRVVILAWLLPGCPSYGESPVQPATTDGGPTDVTGRPSSDGGGGGDAGAEAGLRSCVDGDRQVVDPDTGRCYMYFDNARTWPQAQLACRDLDANLASITGEAENARVASLLVEKGAWLGASDAIQDGNFVWASGDEFEFTRWADGEPDGRFRIDCVELQTDGKWRAEPCPMPKAYVCERN